MTTLALRRSFLSRLLDWLVRPAISAPTPEVTQETRMTVVAPGIEVIPITEFRAKLMARPRGGGHDHMYH